MNPPPDNLRPAPASEPRCSSTELAIPECSCVGCLRELMQAHAPHLLEPELAG